MLKNTNLFLNVYSQVKLIRRATVGTDDRFGDRDLCGEEVEPAGLLVALDGLQGQIDPLHRLLKGLMTLAAVKGQFRWTL